MGRIDIVRMLNLGGQRLILLKGELGEFSSFLAHSFGCYGALCPIAIYKGQTGEKGPKRPLFSSDPPNPEIFMVNLPQKCQGFD